MSDDHSEFGAAGRRHADIAPELRALAQSILDRLDPAIRLAAARAQAGGAGRCQQVWCPVCALAALISGERHPLLTVVAEHSVALLTVLRAMVDNLDDAAEGDRTAGSGQTGDSGDPDPPPDGPSPPDPDGPSGPPPPGRYQHISVTVDD